MAEGKCCKICAGIVTYNPNILLLEKCINSIEDQVEYVILIDNNSTNIEEINKLLEKYRKTELLCNYENKGIAFALNQIANKAIEYGCEWFLTLDQDSICDSRMILVYKEYVNIVDVAVICPNIELRVLNNQTKESMVEAKFEYIDTAITSGSLIRVDDWKKVRGFWEYLFIDKVDDDFCYAVRNNGKRILRTNEIILEHEIGKPVVKKFLWKQYYADNYPKFRYYYIARNTILIHYCYKNTGYNAFKILLIRGAKIILGENRKLAKLSFFIRGIFDGIKWICISGERGIPY